MARRTESYVDSSGFIAFLDRSDTHHPRFRRLFAAPPPLVTSTLVVAECHGWFLRRYDHGRAVQFLDFLHSLAALTLAAFDADALSRARTTVKRHSDQGLTLADAHGLDVMNARRITSCWSTDRHLTLAGAVLVNSKLALLLSCMALSGALLAARQAHQFYVTVMDDDRKPVTGLGSEDFSIKDGGARQPVVDSAPATAPLAVAVVTVGSTAAGAAASGAADDRSATSVSGAIDAFVKAVRTAGADNPAVAIDTDDRGRTGASGRDDLAGDVASAVGAACEALRSSATDRRAILLIVGSSPHPPAPPATTTLVGELGGVKASLWTIEVSDTGRLDGELAAATAASGGYRWRLSTAAAGGLDDAARAIALLLTAAQYVVTANVPVTAASPLPLATRHDRGVVLVAGWSR